MLGLGALAIGVAVLGRGAIATGATVLDRAMPFPSAPAVLCRMTGAGGAAATGEPSKSFGCGRFTIVVEKLSVASALAAATAQRPGPFLRLGSAIYSPASSTIEDGRFGHSSPSATEPRRRTS